MFITCMAGLLSTPIPRALPTSHSTHSSLRVISHCVTTAAQRSCSLADPGQDVRRIREQFLFLVSVLAADTEKYGDMSQESPARRREDRS